MTQTCETCRYWEPGPRGGQPVGTHWYGHCLGLPAKERPETSSGRPACSLYRARGEDQEPDTHVYQEPGEYNIKCTVKPSYDQLAAAVVAARNLLKTQLKFPGMPDMCISAFEALKAMGDLEESS